MSGLSDAEEQRTYPIIEDYPIQRVAERGAAELVTNTVDTLTCQNSQVLAAICQGG